MTKLDRVAIAIIILTLGFLIFVFESCNDSCWHDDKLTCNQHIVAHVERGLPYGETSLPYWMAYNDIDGSSNSYFNEAEAKRSLNEVCKP